jgi:hypothetical protein
VYMAPRADPAPATCSDGWLTGKCPEQAGGGGATAEPASEPADPPAEPPAEPPRGGGGAAPSATP